ncbi:MAG: hypothetical protein Q9222_004246 [Ikaeria aurantiellina]
MTATTIHHDHPQTHLSAYSFFNHPQTDTSIPTYLHTSPRYLYRSEEYMPAQTPSTTSNRAMASTAIDTPSTHHMQTRYRGTKVPFTGERKERKKQVRRAAAAAAASKQQRSSQISPMSSPKLQPADHVLPPSTKINKINCRFRVPGTTLTEYWRDGKKMVCAPDSYHKYPWEGGGFVGVGENHPEGLETCRYLGLCERYKSAVPLWERLDEKLKKERRKLWKLAKGKEGEEMGSWTYMVLKRGRGRGRLEDKDGKVVVLDV